jgi:2-amino-4-hydroxy-6-hydroxymethyldihydropteridine diphosphokinase
MQTPISIKNTATTAYIGIGANLGDARATVNYAIAKLGELPNTRASQTSSLFLSDPIDSSGDDYINAVVEIETQLEAHQLLDHLQALELACGRERPYRNAPRTLDLDVLLYGAEVIATERLIVPHPRMTERAFVLIPLLQLNPFIQIPKQGAAHQFAPSVAHQGIQKLA